MLPATLWGRNTMPSVATTPGRMETFARALDRAVATVRTFPDSRIAELRSSFVATDAQGRSWTLDPESNRWGRLHGERWMVEDPPQQLFMDSELRASLEALEAMAAQAIVKGAELHAPRESSVPNARFRRRSHLGCQRRYRHEVRDGATASARSGTSAGHGACTVPGIDVDSGERSTGDVAGSPSDGGSRR